VSIYFSNSNILVFLFGCNISARGIIFSFGTHIVLGPFMLVFPQDVFLKVPAEIGCTMEELDDVLF